MSKPIDSQVALGAKTKERIAALGIEQGRIARELRRSDAAVHRALKGERRILLERIIKWLKRYQARSQATKSNRSVAA